MVKRTIYTLLAIVCGLNAQAQQVTEYDALQKAKQFLSSKTFTNASLTRGSSEKDNIEPYYVFNAREGGFVIVSGDERTMPVLGYADEGSLDMDNLPEGLQDLLNRYACQVKFLQECDATDAQPQRASTRGAGGKGPLVQTQWNQQAPYWDLCPLQDGINCYTGCTATAMAQIMYYWAVTKGKNKPAKTTTASEDYTPHTDGLAGNAFSANTPINWSNMTTTYSSSSSSAAKTAVAQLMSYCGTAVKMAYNKKGSYGSEGLMSIVPYALKTYFGYPNTVTFEAKESYFWKDWVAMIKAELDADRPVMYSATSTGPGEGGHAFVIDGYDGDGNFHINWGYSGKNDGYFALNVMQYSEKYRYNLPDNMIIGFSPDVVAGKTVPPLRLTATNFGLDQTSDGNRCLNCNFINYTGQKMRFDYGYGYIDATTNQVVVLNCADNTRGFYRNEFTPEYCLSKSQGYRKSKALEEMMQGKPEGSYKLFPISRLTNVDGAEWQICNDGSNYVSFTYYPEGNVFSKKFRNLKVAPNTSRIMTPPAAKTDLVYTGEPQDLIIPGILLEGDMEYWFDGDVDHKSTTIPQATAAGDYTVCYYDYETQQTVSLPVNIGLRGDANGDKKVNVADIVEMVNAKLGKASSKFTKKNADLDRNGSITIAEITTVVGIIMGK